MSNKLTPVSRRELIRRLRKLAFEGPFPGSKHDVMARGDDSVVIPNSHRGEDISVDLLIKILRQAGISRDEWLESK